MYEEGGADIPAALFPPDFLDGFEIWFHDFFRLSTERQIGMAEGEIPASAIDRHIAGWPEDDAYMFEYCIRAMDRVYLARSEPEQTEQPEVSAKDAFRNATAHLRGK